MQMGINNGVDWRIPLSDTNKISRLVNAMTCFGKEYCWTFYVCRKIDRIRLNSVYG